MRPQDPGSKRRPWPLLQRVTAHDCLQLWRPAPRHPWCYTAYVEGEKIALLEAARDLTRNTDGPSSHAEAAHECKISLVSPAWPKLEKQRCDCLQPWKGLLKIMKHVKGCRSHLKQCCLSVHTAARRRLLHPIPMLDGQWCDVCVDRACQSRSDHC